jgi:hypothetical protein
MQKIGLIALTSLVALGLLEAAELGSTDKKAVDESTASSPAPATKQSGNASAQLGLGVTRNAVVSAGASSGTVALGSVGGVGWAPVTPFVSYAMSGIDAADEEFQKLLQQVHERELRMLQNPEYRDLLRAQQRLSLHHNHADLPALLQISKEQADQLLDLLAEHQVRVQVAGRPIASTQSDPAAMHQYIQKAQQRQSENEAEIAALLGASKFQEWKQYEQSAMARFQVQRLQQTLPPNARLQADQRRSLVNALASEQRQLFEQRAGEIPNGVPDEAWHRRMHEDHVQRMASMNERLMERASSILSPQQLEHFETMLKQDLDAMSGRQFFSIGRPAPAIGQ